MIIDLKKPRSEYFRLPTTAEVLRHFVPKDGTENPVTINDLRDLDKNHCLAVGTREGSFEGLLAGNYAADSLSLVDRIAGMDDSQLLVLPPEYRIDAGQSRNVIVYSPDSLILLDSAEVKHALLGDSVPKGKLSRTRKEAEQWGPERVLRTAFDLLHARKDEVIENTFSSYAWWGVDGHRRVVPVYRAIEGAELLAFQDLAEMKIEIPSLKFDLAKGSDKNGVPFTSGEKSEKLRRLDVLRRYIANRGIHEPLVKLEVDLADIIHLDGEPYASGTGYAVFVPSLTRPNPNPQFHPDVYEVKMNGVARAHPEHPVLYSQPWETAPSCLCKDNVFRSDRRGLKAYRGQPENFFCVHAVAALQWVRRNYSDDIHAVLTPLVIPTPETMKLVDILRHQAVILEHNDATSRWSRRALNKTEIGNIAIKNAIARGYDRSFTTIPSTLREQGLDLRSYLVRFRM